MTSTKLVNWISSTNKAIECKITSTREAQSDIAYADGYNIDLGKITHEDTNIKITIDGKFFDSCYEPKLVVEPYFSAAVVKQVKSLGGVALLANKIALTQDIYNQIMSVINETQVQASKDEEYTAVKAIEIKKELDEIIKEQVQLDNYKKQIANVLCPKCGSYCYGDCESN